MASSNTREPSSKVSQKLLRLYSGAVSVLQATVDSYISKILVEILHYKQHVQICGFHFIYKPEN